MLEGVIDAVRGALVGDTKSGSLSYAKEDLARLTREDYEYRKKLLEPYEGELRDLASDTSIVDDAQERAGSIAERGLGQTDRMLSRYGAGRTGAQANMSSRNALLSQARTGTNMINNAQDQQTALQYNMLGQGVASGRRRLNNALGMLGDSAGMASERQSAYQNALAQNQAAHNNAMNQYRSNRNSTYAAIAGIGAFALGI